MESLLKTYNFINVENNKEEHFRSAIENKPSFILLIISPCLSCPEHYKISLLKDLSKMAKDRANFLLLFGKGNDYERIRQFAEKNNVLGSFKVGIFTNSNIFSENDYYKIFDLEIDPRLLIYNEKGQISFLEELTNRNKISFDFLRGFLKW